MEICEQFGLLFEDMVHIIKLFTPYDSFHTITRVFLGQTALQLTKLKDNTVNWNK